MTEKHINHWIMYHQIHQLGRQGLSRARIARQLHLDPRTVGKYLQMDEQEFEQFRKSQTRRSRKLSGYQEFVREKLTAFPDTSAAQMHDWLKEHHPQFPPVSPRTVFNFVMFIRAEYNIPVTAVLRDYLPVEELEWGLQAQVDFGQFNMRKAGGGRKIVYFFVMVLSRSRMKYLWFSTDRFTTVLTCQAHQHAWTFFGGITAEVVYDLDRLMVVDENLGQVLLTEAFKSYVSTAGFQLHFCRKSDPESKGKVENVVGYVKKNFLYNRVFTDLQTLNLQALAWLERTANHLPHGVTRQSPAEQHQIEKKYLAPCRSIPIQKPLRTYHVRKNNTISYKGNFYSLPGRTYRGRGSRVLLKEQEGMLQVYGQDQTMICKHPVASGRGHTVINTHHRRDTTESLDRLIDQAAGQFARPDRAKAYLGQIRQRMPRYTRDHVRCILQALQGVDPNVADQALAFCTKNELYSGREYQQVLQVFAPGDPPGQPASPIRLLHGGAIAQADQTPLVSNLEDYEAIINPSTTA